MTSRRQVDDRQPAVGEEDALMSVAPYTVVVRTTVIKAVGHTPNDGKPVVAGRAGLKIPKPNDAAHERSALIHDRGRDASTQLVGLDVDMMAL